MKYFLLPLFMSLSIAVNAQTSTATDSTYQHFWQLQTGYLGARSSHLVEAGYGLVKVCKTCDHTHRKMFGFGLEGGWNTYDEWIYGPKLFYQREGGRMGFRLSLLAFHWPQREFYHAAARPELLFYPLKNKKFSLSGMYNFQLNLTPSIISNMMSVIAVGLRYYW